MDCSWSCHRLLFLSSTLCLKKTGPLRLVRHNFTNSQRSLIIFGTERPHSTVCATLWTESFLLNEYQNNKMFSGVNSYNTCSDAVLRPWHRPTMVLLLVCCPADDTVVWSRPRNLLFRCQVATVVMETTQLVLSQFKNFLSWSMENWIRSLCAKNI